MYTTSEFAVWIKQPLPNTGVVIITHAALPKYIIDKLHVAIDDWDQVAYLIVKQPRELMLDWLRASSDQSDSNTMTACHAGKLLHSVSKNSFLIDVEVSLTPNLAWLGSVCGHKLRFVKLSPSEPFNAAMDQQVEKILSMARTLAKNVLEERCMI
jgi:hypothetical protein